MKEAQHPAPRARCRSLFSPPSHSAHTPPQLSHFSPPKAATFPAESVTFCNLYDGGCSCKQDGIFIWTLFPVCRLGGFICWYLVLSFLIKLSSLCHIGTEMSVCLPPGHLLRGLLSCTFSPPAAPSPVTSRYPLSPCSEQKPGRLGGQRGNKSIFTA